MAISTLWRARTNTGWTWTPARIRTDFNITTARWKLPKTLREAQLFAQRVGYPVIVKPDKGLGAASTYKFHDVAELAAF
ncbi:MAG: hypothetical protein ACI3U8_06580 [Candidatus Onthomonas sp.]